jgi:nucleoside-diphosphate-sugar epimerase
VRIAILGATSQIAKDLVLSFSRMSDYDLVLFARRPSVVNEWLQLSGLSDRYSVYDFKHFNAHKNLDAIINFVGFGNPALIASMGSSIFDVTSKYDELALDYLRYNPDCRYVFLSSGAAYGSNFEQPVDENSRAEISINNLTSMDWYAVAKLQAECHHRSLSNFPIVDIRVFNYFSHTQDIAARFFISDILRAIQSDETLVTSSDNIVRDYIGPGDFFRLISLILETPPMNTVIDCYSQAPVEKMTLLASIKESFGLRYEVSKAPAGVNATGLKMNYFSMNRRAEIFGYSPSNNSLNNVISEIELLRMRHF